MGGLYEPVRVTLGERCAAFMFTTQAGLGPLKHFVEALPNRVRSKQMYARGGA